MHFVFHSSFESNLKKINMLWKLHDPNLPFKIRHSARSYERHMQFNKVRYFPISTILQPSLLKNFFCDFVLHFHVVYTRAFSVIYT